MKTQIINYLYKLGSQQNQKYNHVHNAGSNLGRVTYEENTG